MGMTETEGDWPPTVSRASPKFRVSWRPRCCILLPRFSFSRAVLCIVRECEFGLFWQQEKRILAAGQVWVPSPARSNNKLAGLSYLGRN